MATNIAIVGEPNTGKSWGRTYITHGERCILLNPSSKQSYLKTSEGKVIQPFDIKTNLYSNLAEAVQKTELAGPATLIKAWTTALPSGTFKKENLLGNAQLIRDMNLLPIYGDFISKHLPFIDTIIVPDFTHSISRVLANMEFIERKAGGDAYQKFWELAAEALQNFIIKTERYRDDLIVVTEYHSEFDEHMGGYDIYVPGGKMVKEKFKIPSYYDIMLYTDVKRINEGQDDEYSEYRYVTKPTKKYPFARAMNMFETTFIPNNLQHVMDTTRKTLQLKNQYGTQ